MQFSSFKTMFSSQQTFMSLVFLFLSMDLCHAGVYRYRKSAHNKETGHKLRHSVKTRSYDRDCFFSPVNCVLFLNTEPGINPSSFSESDIKIVEYHADPKPESEEATTQSSEKESSEEQVEQTEPRSKRRRNALLFQRRRR